MVLNQVSRGGGEMNPEVQSIYHEDQDEWLVWNLTIGCILQHNTLWIGSIDYHTFRVNFLSSVWYHWPWYICKYSVTFVIIVVIAIVSACLTLSRLRLRNRFNREKIFSKWIWLCILLWELPLPHYCIHSVTFCNCVRLYTL